ncbi:hypothetical protein D3C87_1923770 [compost metagenome]
MVLGSWFCPLPDIAATTNMNKPKLTTMISALTIKVRKNVPKGPRACPRVMFQKP